MYDLFHQPELSQKEIAIERSYQATTDDWKELAIDYLKEFAAYGKEFIAEDFRLWSEKEKGLEQPSEPRAYGGLMVRAKSAGIIKATGKYKTTSSEKSHSRPMQVWIGQVK